MDEEQVRSGRAGRMGPLKRRDFLKMALGAGMVMLVDACSPSQPPAPTAAPAAPAAPAAKAPAAKAPAAPTAAPAAKPGAKPIAAPAAAPPKPTGTLTVALSTIGNPTYVPSRLDIAARQIAVASFGETLLGRNKDLSLGSELAESWSVSPDGKTLTFELRKGIKWHDGTEFTSADVKFTIDQVVSKDSTSSNLGMWRSSLDRVEAPTPQKVLIHLKERDIGIPFGVSKPSHETQVIFCKSYIEKAGESQAAQKPVGTGPWKFVELRTGELIRFEAVENHWRQTPAFKELVIRQVPEESTRVAMVLRGEADLAEVNTGSAKRLQSGGAQLFTDPTAYCLFISLQGQFLPTREHFDPKVPWAADPADKQAWDRALKVRQAMNLAIDRQTIVDTIFAGQGKPATYVYAVPGSAFDDPAWKPIPYDPDKAKQLLAEAGYPDGFEFPLLLGDPPGRPGGPEAGEAAAQYWQAIGLRPKLQRADYSATIRPAIAARSKPGMAYTWAMKVYAEPAIGHTGMFVSDTDTIHGAEYPPLDDLVSKALSTADPEQRRTIELQIGKMVLDLNLVVPLVWGNGLWGGSKRIKEFPRVPGVTAAYNFEYVIPA